MLPTAFVLRISAQFPQDHEAIIAALDSKPATSILLNPAKEFVIRASTQAGKDNAQRAVEIRNVAWCRNGILLNERPIFTLDPLLHAGCYYPQESSSMFIRYLLQCIFPSDKGQLPPANCLDLCAAPGGKSFLISSYFGDKAKIISNEVIVQRNAVLRENVTKWGARNMVVTRNDPAHFSTLENQFDLVLVDAPCSGEGMFRKDPDAQQLWSPENVQMCSARQRRILGEVLPCIVSGGYLIYCTCTFSPNENEDNCRWLARQGLSKVRFEVPAQWNLDIIDEADFFAVRMLPHRVAGEGFFVSVFRATAGEKVSYAKSHRREKKRNRRFTVPSVIERNIVSKWVAHEMHLVLDSKDNSWLFSSFNCDELNVLSQHLDITLPGIEAGRVVRDELVPAHALAVSGLINENIPRIGVDEETALCYLRGENFPVESHRHGWALVTFQNHALGWIKILHDRINNYYPKAWRVRMSGKL